MKCRYCGCEIEEEFQFCKKCGKAVDKTPTINTEKETESQNTFWDSFFLFLYSTAEFSHPFSMQLPQFLNENKSSYATDEKLVSTFDEVVQKCQLAEEYWDYVKNVKFTQPGGELPVQYAEMHRNNKNYRDLYFLILGLIQEYSNRCTNQAILAEVMRINLLQYVVYDGKVKAYEDIEKQVQEKLERNKVERMTESSFSSFVNNTDRSYKMQVVSYYMDKGGWFSSPTRRMSFENKVVKAKETFSIRTTPPKGTVHYVLDD